MVKVSEIQSFKDYGKCVCITNGVIEAYVTVEIGPRIIRFGYVGGQNIMMSDNSEFKPKTSEKYQQFFGKGKAWNNYGGHRLWLSPEADPETYYPDGDPVNYSITPSGAVFTPKPQTENGVAFEIELKMDADDANMQVVMRVKNISSDEKEFSLWGLSVSEKNGTVIIPMNTNDTGLLSNRIVSVWPYTDMSDPRIYWGNKYVTVAQNTAAETPLKLGFDLNCGTVYYVLGGDVFRKSYATYHPDAKYPDGGCSFETYSCSAFIEVESLGALKCVKPGETSEHIESWELMKKPCEVDFRSDASIENLLAKL